MSTLTDQGFDAGFDVDYVETLPVAETEGDLANAVAWVGALRRAGRNAPAGFAAFFEAEGLRAVAGSDGGLQVES